MPELMAHRGNSALAPENTLAAFAEALQSPAQSMELDVYLSGDGAVVVMHDPTVDRTTNGTGAIAEMTLRQLKTLDAGSWFGPGFVGEPVPTLAEVVALVGDRLKLNVEIKSAADPDSSRKVVEVLREGGVLAQSMISSFGLGALLETRKLWPEGTLALIAGKGEDLQIAIDHGLQWFNVYYHEATPALVQRAHEAGLQVMVWTMDDPVLWPHYAQMGVDGICTNAPHLMPV
ncbi:MAG: glycerophosphodiester phosphodiesterase family protein [Armatimonadota bacterium]